MIEGTDVFEYFLCPYKVYNRHNRDRSLMVPASEFTRRLIDLGKNHEKELISSIEYSRPEYSFGDFTKGFLQTFKLMQIGSEVIYQGVLKEGEYLGIPDILFRQKGESKLGSYYYIPADIKSTLRSKDEQIMQLMFYNMVLEKIQGYSSGKGILILKDCSEMIDLTKHQDKFKQALSMIERINKGLEYGLHIDSVCKDCPWRNVCIPIAEEKKDVSLVYGLSRPAHYKIQEIGIETLGDLSRSETSKVAESLGNTESVIEKWKEQANVILTNKDKITKLELPKTKHHVCLDIETAEDGSLYLIGLWHNGEFKYFFSENDERKIINEFIDYVLSLEDFRLYHYGVYEKTLFRQLFERYGIEEHIRKTIYDNMIDLFTLVKRHAVLPLKYYNLKDVAKHFGFKWRSSDASGGNSIMWYEEWRKNKDEKLLKKILDYNEDDVKGTHVVLEKLSEENI